MMPRCSCTVIQLQQFLLSDRVSLICNSLITWATAASPGCVQWHGIDMIPESSLLHPHIRNASRRGAHLCASFLDTVDGSGRCEHMHRTSAKGANQVSPLKALLSAAKSSTNGAATQRQRCDTRQFLSTYDIGASPGIAMKSSTAVSRCNPP